MAAPTIQLDQVPLAPGVPGASRQDLALAVAVVCTDPANGAGAYAWTLVPPPLSAAVLTGAATDTATFTPDIPGTYLVYLDFGGEKSFTLNADGEKISLQGGAGVKHRQGVRALGVGETLQFSATEGWALDFAPNFATIDAVEQAKNGALGSVFYSDTLGDLAELAAGTAGFLLRTNGAAPPTWIDPDSLADLQTSYDGGAAIVTGAGGAVDISRVLSDAANVLELAKNPGAANAGSALAITMGAQSTDPAIDVANGGAEAVINSTAAMAFTVASVEAARFNANLDTQLAGSLFLKERASEAADIPTYGQLWAKTDQTLFFTDSAGVDTQLGTPGNLAVIATPTFTSVQHMRDTIGSAGCITGGGITDDTDGTITVAAGTGLIRATNNSTAEILNFDWAAESGALVDLVTDAMNFVYAEYNAGSPRVVATTIVRTNFQTNVLLATVYRDGTNLDISEHNHQLIGDTTNLDIQRMKDVDPFARASGGVIGETGTRNISVSTGSWWQAFTPFTTAAFDSSAADNFTYSYRDGVGGFTVIATQTQIDNLQFDDGTGVLATLSNNRFGVHWVYIEQDGDVHVLYGRGDYVLEDAENAGAPSDLPPQFAENHTRIIGKIIIAKSAAVFTLLESAFDTQFQGAAPTDHGSLLGLTDDDHLQYLLTTGSRLLTGPQAWDSGGAADPSVRASTLDPSAGGGIASPEGSMLMRYVAAAGELWLKDGAADTAWTQVGTGGGGTLDAAYDFGGAGAGRAIIADSGAVTLTTDAIGVAETTAFELINSTVAAAGAQQFSPMSVMQGSGWKTDATAAPQTVLFAQQLETIQGAANPSGDLVFKSNVNGAGYVDAMRVRSGGGVESSLLWLTERAAAETNEAGKGQIWVDNLAAQTAYFTDDAGVDFPFAGDLAASGSGSLDDAYDSGGAGAGRAIIADTGAITLTTDGVGVAETTAFELINSTAAAAGVQQFSPMLVLEGQGWKTDATAATQEVLFAQQLETVQGAANPIGELVFKSNVNGAGYVDQLKITSDGHILLNDTGGSVLIPVLGFASDATKVAGLMRNPSNGDITLMAPGIDKLILGVGNVSVVQCDPNLVFGGLRAGSEANPYYYLNSDITTGIFRPAANIYAFATAGTEAMRLDASQVQTNAGGINPDIDSAHDLGLTGTRWRELFVDDITLTADLTAGGDLDAAGGFRRSLSIQYLISPAQSSTYTLKIDGSLAGLDALGWFVMPRAGSVVEISVWADADIAAGQVNFWVESSTDGGDTWVSEWGSSGGPILALDSVSNPEVNRAAQAKDASVVAASTVVRIRAATDASFSASRSIYATIGVEC